MHFKEWVKETKNSMESDIPEELVCEVLVTAIRTAFEELMANRAHADLEITGIGRFYMNYGWLRCGIGKGVEKKKRWSIHFKPSVIFKSLINGEKSLIGYGIGGKALGAYPLYPQHNSKFRMNNVYKVKVIKKKSSKPVKKSKKLDKFLTQISNHPNNVKVAKRIVYSDIKREVLAKNMGIHRTTLLKVLKEPLSNETTNQMLYIISAMERGFL